MYIFAVQLVELIGHASATLIANDACKSNTERSNQGGEPVFSSQYSNPFEFYGKQRENVYVQALTVVSAYAIIHEDICNLAEDESVTLTTWKQKHIDSDLDSDSDEQDTLVSSSFFMVNTSILIVQQGGSVEDRQDASDDQEM
ncbi:hypothetical protein M0R45_014601 [Rubus argutus]|uniref:Uncharacterized protein n=1 Tax=Rubus argutus TaxID=59490 RepID=A0AAW1XN51_RUBAR